jgi:hypothetical protein
MGCRGGAAGEVRTLDGGVGSGAAGEGRTLDGGVRVVLQEKGGHLMVGGSTGQRRTLDGVSVTGLQLRRREDTRWGVGGRGSRITLDEGVLGRAGYRWKDWTGCVWGKAVNQSINQVTYIVLQIREKNLYSRALYISNIAIAFKK